MAIFKKQRFECAGCGRSLTGKSTVEPKTARAPMSPPAGWFTVDFDAQHKETGAIAVLRVFACSEQCALTAREHASKSEGAGTVDVMVRKFTAIFNRDDNGGLVESAPAAPTLEAVPSET